ncbi:flagellar motor switch protein FliM [Chitinivibrio alkaliphilus]|uniref:Flagellar motor switch protein FliM n=1 Tax=Chitinivibrio alkaliphilus ACht1 TaxID=1313304 RepID=U7DCC4_9BACT|nr:flagellar motor switch protein FliM [Chitinivibrio alkaliphilus]ERP32075.1 flagellar motor switch protein FliM [Chitinivibrio alkaliphilus ACht1]
MSDILSQDEIDALLSAVNEDDVEESPSHGDAPVAESLPEEPSFDESFSIDYDSDDDDDIGDRVLSLYDFRRPDRVSKEQMRTIHNLHEGYARLFSTTLTNYLRTFVEIEVVSVDQLTYSEFIMSISNPSCIHLFQMEPIDVTAIFEMNPSLVFFMIDRLFGGLGRGSENNRELTKIEQNVIRSIVSRGLGDLSGAWEHMGSFNPRITNYETNPMFVQIVPPGETVILITFEVHMLKSSGLMSICFPYQIIEQIFSELEGNDYLSTTAETTPETIKTMEEEIQDVTVPLSALIGKTQISIRDLLQLQTDDIICLDKHKDANLIVQIGGKSKMGAKSGVSGRKKAVKITKIFEQEFPAPGKTNQGKRFTTSSLEDDFEENVFADAGEDTTKEDSHE